LSCLLVLSLQTSSMAGPPAIFLLPLLICLSCPFCSQNSTLIPTGHPLPATFLGLCPSLGLLIGRHTNLLSPVPQLAAPFLLPVPPYCRWFQLSSLNPRLYTRLGLVLPLWLFRRCCPALYTFFCVGSAGGVAS